MARLLPFCCALMLLATSGCFAGEVVQMRVRSHHLAGDELRLIVETSRSWTPLLSHSSRTADSKGYLVLVDLASEKPLPERARVVGPLWDVPHVRSSISAETGLSFTPADAEAAAATPAFAFEADGTLLRFARNAARGVTERDALDLTPTGGSWKRQGDRRQIPDDLPPLSENRLVDEARRVVLLRREGGSECFNLLTGDPVRDPWLTQVFAEVRAIKDLNNVRIFLTADLNHLVVCPMAIWNDGRGRILETFEFGGRTLRRADVGLAYSRPAEKPLLFPRKPDEQVVFLLEPPTAVLSIGGELFLFEKDAAKLRLYTPDGRKERVAKAKTEASWKATGFADLQHLPAAGELALFESAMVWSGGARADDTLGIVRWDYERDKVTRQDLPIGDLFEQRGGLLQPKKSAALPN